MEASEKSDTSNSSDLMDNLLLNLEKAAASSRQSIQSMQILYGIDTQKQNFLQLRRLLYSEMMLNTERIHGHTLSLVKTGIVIVETCRDFTTLGKDLWMEEPLLSECVKAEVLAAKTMVAYSKAISRLCRHKLLITEAIGGQTRPKGEPRVSSI